MIWNYVFGDGMTIGGRGASSRCAHREGDSANRKTHPDAEAQSKLHRNKTVTRGNSAPRPSPRHQGAGVAEIGKHNCPRLNTRRTSARFASTKSFSALPTRRVQRLTQMHLLLACTKRILLAVIISKGPAFILKKEWPRALKGTLREAKIRNVFRFSSKSGAPCPSPACASLQSYSRC
jgi:hypothetical protein